MSENGAPDERSILRVFSLIAVQMQRLHTGKGRAPAGSAAFHQ